MCRVENLTLMSESLCSSTNQCVHSDDYVFVGRGVFGVFCDNSADMRPSNIVSTVDTLVCGSVQVFGDWRQIHYFLFVYPKRELRQGVILYP